MYAKIHLKSVKLFKQKKQQKNKDKLWYDRDCENKKNETKNISKEKSSNPLDRELREKFREKMKQYKLLCKQKRSMFWNAKIKELKENSSKNDTQFWNNWKQFSEDRIKNNTEVKDGNKWENYYKNLYSETQVKSLPPADIKEPNQILNRRITEKELKIVIKKLKKKKVVGFDNLSNEMFKDIPDKFLGMLLVIFK